MELKVDKEFRSIIPPLTQQEYKQLEENIIKDGCRDSIILWEGVIIDGHNRYEICTKRGIGFKTADTVFETREDAKLWMISNAFGQRNLTDGQKWELSQTRKDILLKKGRKKQSHGETAPGRTLLSNIDKSDSHNTRNEIAKELGWSTGKVAMADVVWKDSEPEVKEKVKSGELSINQAYSAVKKKKKREKNTEKHNDFAKATKGGEANTQVYIGDCLEYMDKCESEKYDLILTDPPYAMDFKSGWNDWQKIDGDKRTDTIKLLDIAFHGMHKVMKDDAHIYVFGNPYEVENIKPLFTKYFKLKNILIWDRKVIGMGDLSTYGRSYDIVYFGYKNTWKDLVGTRNRDILQHERLSPDKLVHPTEKPTNILEFIIKKSSKEGDHIFDPFAGSCSTLRAAAGLSRNSDGCELENQYIPTWIKRIK